MRTTKAITFCIARSVCLFLLTTALSLRAEEHKSQHGHAATHTNFTLAMHNDLLSLTATDVPLKVVLDEIGLQMHIVVEATLPPEERITVKFTNLPLEEALQRLSTNYAFITNSTKENGKITKILVSPAGGKQSATGQGHVQQEEAESESQSFRFEFDPSQHMQPGK